MLEFPSLRINLAYPQPQSPNAAFHERLDVCENQPQLMSWQGTCTRKGHLKAHSRRWTTWTKHSTIFQLKRNLSVVRTVFYCRHDHLRSWLVIGETEKCCLHKHFWVPAESIACSNICTLPIHPWGQNSTEKKQKKFKESLIMNSL